MYLCSLNEKYYTRMLNIKKKKIVLIMSMLVIKIVQIKLKYKNLYFS